MIAEAKRFKKSRMSSSASVLVTLVSPQLVPTFAVRAPEQNPDTVFRWSMRSFAHHHLQRES